MVGTPAKMVTLSRLHDPQRRVGREAGQQGDGRAAGEGRVHDHRLAEGVEQRQHRQRHVLPIESHHVARGHGVHHHVGVGQLRALGATGGAGGVENNSRVVGHGLHRVEDGRLAGHDAAQRRHPLALDRRRGSRIDGGNDQILAGWRLLEALEGHLRHGQVGRALEGDHGDGVAVVEVIGHLAALEEHVERHHGGPDLEDGVVGDGKVGQVGARQGDLVAALDAQLAQAVGQLVGRAVELGIGRAWCR